MVSAIAAAEIASGVLATRSGTQTRTMPGTSCIRVGDLGRGLGPARRAALLAVGDAQQDDSLALAQVGRHADVAHGGADVGLQDALELLSVTPLEHDLAQLEQHARLIRAVRARGIVGRSALP